MADPTDVHPLAQAQIDAHDALAPKIAAEHKQHIVDLLENFESDIAPLIAPFAQQLIDDPTIPDRVRQLLAPLAAPQHFGESIIIGIAIGSILSPVLGAAFQPEVQGIANLSWSANRSRPLTPDLLAAMALKGVSVRGNTQLGDGSLTDEAGLSGISGERFAAMTQAAGQSLGLAESLLLERRNEWVNATIDEALAYSNMNPKFYASAKNLRYVPPPAGEIISARVKNHIGDAQAQTLLRHFGIDPADTAGGPISNYDWMLLAAGRPLGLEQMFSVMHRGGATMTDVEDTLRQSDINDHWAKFLPYLQYHYPPLFQVERAVKAGSMQPARAKVILGYEGYEAQDIDAVIAAAQTTATTTVHEASVSQILRMLEANLINEQEALQRIENHKLDPATAQLIIDLAAELRKETLLNATIRKVGTLYVAHRLSQVDAQAALNTAGVPVAAQHDLFFQWDIQRTATSHVPTPAMVVAAGRRQEIPPSEVKLRLNQLGIANADLAIFVADGWPPTKSLEAQAAAAAVFNNLATWPPILTGGAPPPKRLTVVQISQLYSAGTIGKAEATADLVTLGYSATTAAQLVSTFPAHVPPVP